MRTVYLDRLACLVKNDKVKVIKGPTYEFEELLDWITILLIVFLDLSSDGSLSLTLGFSWG